MHDMELPVPAAYGIVEITPEREYLIVMEFFDRAVEINEADVDDEIIDEGLLLVRNLWDAGLAHRDIKPGNLMVRDGKVLLVDAFFVQVRPSPWRQAVDLGNMMLVLAVGSTPERVYQRALQYFTPEEIAEAFAATRGVASPSQLRLMIKQDPRDLLAQFRRLAPERRPIPIQRWSVRRVALAAGLVVSLVVAVGGTVYLLTPDQDFEIFPPTCRAQTVTVLMAQAVPTATAVPCIEALPTGLSFATAIAHNGEARFWLDSDRAGARAVTVTLTGSCDTSSARPVPTDETGTERFDSDPAASGGGSGPDRFYRLPGGCVTYDYSVRRPDRSGAHRGRGRRSGLSPQGRARGLRPRAGRPAPVRRRHDLPGRPLAGPPGSDGRRGSTGPRRAVECQRSGVAAAGTGIRAVRAGPWGPAVEHPAVGLPPRLPTNVRAHRGVGTPRAGLSIPARSVTVTLRDFRPRCGVAVFSVVPS